MSASVSSTLTKKIPSELRALPQWVVWRFEPNPKRPEKPSKVPYSEKERQASTTDPATWLSFGASRRLARGSGFGGIAFVFSPDDSYVGVDLDGCRNPETGEVTSWAAKIIDDLNSYTE